MIKNIGYPADKTENKNVKRTFPPKRKQEEEDSEPEEQEKDAVYVLVDETKKQKETLFVPLQPPPAPENVEQKFIQSFVDFVDPYIRMALDPFYTVVGEIQMDSGVPVAYRFIQGASMEERMSPIDRRCNTLKEFIFKNRHIKKVLDIFLEPWQESQPKTQQTLMGFQLIGDNVANVDDFVRQFYGPFAEYNNLEAWVKSALDDPVFQFLIPFKYGALELAANELGFPLKDLVLSKKVNWMFAQFVSRKFVMPKQNVFADRVSGGQVGYRLSSGFNTSHQTNEKWLMGCKFWFKQVHYVKVDISPETIRRAEEKLAEARDFEQQNFNAFKDNFATFKNAVLEYLQNFPNDPAVQWNFNEALYENNLEKLYEIILFYKNLRPAQQYQGFIDYANTDGLIETYKLAREDKVARVQAEKELRRLRESDKELVK